MVLPTRYLDPKLDITFKRIFGTEKNKNLLINFLNQVLRNQIKNPIEIVTFLQTAQGAELISKKQSVVDVLCVDSQGVKYIIEMQVAPGNGFEKRAQFYAAKAYIEQMQAGDKQYHNLKEVIFIAIVEYDIFPKKKNYKSEHVILDRETLEQDLNMFSFTFINLRKFARDKLPKDLTEKQILAKLSLEEKWYYFLCKAENTQESDLEELKGDSEVIKQAYIELDKFAWTEAELASYDAELKRKLDNEAVEALMIETAEQRGLEKGIEKGKIEGAMTRNMEIARNLLIEKMEIKSIVKITGLSEEEIRKL